MAEKIQIASDQTQLARGNELPVRVLVQFEKTTKVRGIRAHFHGAEKTKADYTDFNISTRQFSIQISGAPS